MADFIRAIILVIQPYHYEAKIDGYDSSKFILVRIESR